MMATDVIPPDRHDRYYTFDGISLASLVLRLTEYFYTLVLLVTFISGAAWYSIFNSKKDEDLVQTQAKGPGGKPLPLTKRKRRDNGERKIGPHFGFVAKNVFRSIAAGVCLAYMATAASAMKHAFVYEDPYEWTQNGLAWAGTWTVVSPNSSPRNHV
jgi:hypothetical protein